VTFALLVFGLGAFFNRDGQIGQWISNTGVDLQPATISHWFEGRKASPRRIYIEMKPEKYQKLAEQREQAMNDGVLVTSKKDYVKAVIRSDEQSIPVKIRLKGDWTDHLQGKKWSFRVKTRGENTLFGMKRFSLHRPATRNYLMEWVFHRALSREDVLSLRYDFIALTLNGKDLGVYAVEEHFEKRLVESQRRREGPIIRFSEDYHWDDELRYRDFPGTLRAGTGDYVASDIDSFQTGKWLSDPARRDLHNRAVTLLESFRRGDLTTSEVFDTGALARFVAISDVMGGEHGVRWHNTRFYYNPITARLEPIGFDADAGSPILDLTYENPRDKHLYRSMFTDAAFLEQYLVELHRVSQPEYLDALFNDIGDELENNLRVIYSEYPAYDFKHHVLQQNQKYIRTVLDPSNALLAYQHRAESGPLEIRVGNLQSIPLRVVGVSFNEQELVFPAASAAIPGRKNRDEVIDFQPIRTQFVNHGPEHGNAKSTVEVRYQLLGSEKIYQTRALNWPYADTRLITGDLMRAEHNVAEFPFLQVDETAKTIRIKQGEWTISKNLIVPEDYTLVCGEGTHLVLTNSASILSFSPLKFIGTEESPIRITSPQADGQGVFVLGGGRLSSLEHVLFENLAAPSRPGWELTGAVTFYESTLEIRHTLFKGSRSEDSLNVIRSKFLITDSAFMTSRFDALDSDFCTGSILRTRFEQSGNDAIDVSGSSVTIDGVRIRRTGDKGLSMGENSHVLCGEFSVSSAALAIAIKDKSILEAMTINVSDCENGVAVYQKKSEFGPASGKINTIHFESTPNAYLVESGSRLQVDGNPIPIELGQFKDVVD